VRSGGWMTPSTTSALMSSDPAAQAAGRPDGVYLTAPGTGLNPDIAHQAAVSDPGRTDRRLARGEGSQVAGRGGPAASSVSMNGHRRIR
jgi:hypothetical protein